LQELAPQIAVLERAAPNVTVFDCSSTPRICVQRCDAWTPFVRAAAATVYVDCGRAQAHV
jgi:hypothetical protein